MNGAADTHRKLRVMMMIDRLLPGGAESVAVNLLTRLDPDRFERTLCVTRWDPEDAEDPTSAAAREALRRAEVRLIGVRRRHRLGVWSWRPLLERLRRERVDVLHGHKFGSNVWAAILGSLARTPVVIAHEHNWSFEGQPLRRALDKHLIARRADAFIAVSEAARRGMIESEGIDAEKVLVLHSGIEAAPPRADGDVRAELGIGADAPVIGTLCTLRREKALEVLIDAARRLRERFPELRVLIAGLGPEQARLESLVAELGMSETVLFLGHRDDVYGVLRAVDVAVCCSDWEGSPLSVLEYMEAARPMVVTRVGGIPEIVEAGKEGLMVAPRDPEALAAAIAELLDDPERAGRMAREGQEKRRREFDLEVTARRLGELYESLWGRKERTRMVQRGGAGGA